jgi:small subunit ribosomal protein S6
MVIVDAALEEGDTQKAVDQFIEAIAAAGGTAGNVDRWGKRRFAYEINHKNEGYYFVADFTADEEAVAKLLRTLAISDAYIRGKIVHKGPDGSGAKAADKTSTGDRS